MSFITQNAAPEEETMDNIEINVDMESLGTKAATLRLADMLDTLASFAREQASMDHALAGKFGVCDPELGLRITINDKNEDDRRVLFEPPLLAK